MKPLFLFFFSAGVLSAAAQDKNQFFALDANMNQTVLDSSKYILWIHQKEDSNWQWDYYNTWGPLIKSQSFADHDGTIRNGRFCIYNKMGNLDSTGIFDLGKKNGSFLKYRTFTKDSMPAVMQYDYMQDSLVKSIDLMAERQKNKVSDTTNGREPAYPGGPPKWTDYLSLNLIYPERAKSKKIQGQVRIFFIVDEEGHVKEPYIERSVEYSLDQESLRVIKNSGTWNPAVQDGVNKKSYTRMPIDYRLETK